MLVERQRDRERELLLVCEESSVMNIEGLAVKWDREIKEIRGFSSYISSG